MAKKKSGYELWKEVEAQEAQRKAEGKVNFKEDSRATRVQYSLPHYQGRSETDKTYNWEKELLDPIKIKGVRSYNDKFEAWAAQQGLEGAYAKEFRKYMDFQEDSQWQEPELNKDGEVKQNQSLNYARGAYIKGGEIDSILNNMTDTFKQNTVNKQEMLATKQATQEETKVQQDQRNSAVKSYKEDDDRPAYAKFIDRFLLPISKGATEVLAPGNNERMIQNDLADGEIDNPVNQASLVDRGLETDILEGAGTIAGYVAPYGQGYKAADIALNKIPQLARVLNRPIAERATRGAIAGLGAESGLAATQELFNSEAKDAQDYALQIGLGAAGGAVLDPALYGIGVGLKKGAEKSAQGLVPDSVPFSEEGFQQALQDVYGNPITFGQTARPQGRSAVPPVTQPTAQAVNPLDSFTTPEIPTVETPGALRDTPKTAKIEDVVRSYGHNDVTPETIASSYNQKQWYHGTGTANLTPENLDPFSGNHESLFGQGIYMTDDPEIAKGYARSRGKKTSNPTVYEANVNVNRVLNLEQPITQDVAEAIAKFTQPLDYAYKRATWEETPHFTNILNDMVQQGKTSEEIIQRLRNEISDFSHDNQIPTSEFVENFQDLAVYLKQSGYDGITHTGGGRTGHEAHRVLIPLDPNDWYAQTGRANQVTSFKPNNPDELISRVRETNFQNTSGQPDTNSIDELLRMLNEGPSAPKTVGERTTPKLSEDAYVDEQLAPYRESQQAQANAQATWETTVKQAKTDSTRIKGTYGKIIPDGKSKDAINEIPPQFKGRQGGKGIDIYTFADQEGFASADEAVAYLKKIDTDSKLKLKDIYPDDGMQITEEQWAGLEDAARRTYREQYATPEDILNDLTRTQDQTAPTRNPSELADEILKRFENVNNSQAVDNTLDDLNPSSKLFMNLDGKVNKPSEASTSKVEGKFKPLVRLGAQRFNDNADASPKLFSDGEVGSDKAIDKFADKVYENYVNMNHSFKVAETKVIENEIKRLKELGGAPKKVQQLEQQLKEVKKSGSPLEKSVNNEMAAGVGAKDFLKRHLKTLDDVVSSDAEMADALRYQLASDLNWRRENGFLPDDYEINSEVNWGDINDIITRGQDNETFKAFNSAFRNMTQEWRDIMLEYGLINKASHELLSKNPYYMPLARDFTPGMSNVDRGMHGRGAGNNRTSSPTILHTISDGEANALFKNPIDSLVNNTFAVYKNAYKEETGRQILRLAKMDKDNLFFREVSSKAAGGNIVSVSNGGKQQRIRIQDDLMDLFKENEEYIKTDFLGQLTSAFASLKTRSLEYQSGAIVRDMGAGYVNSQITDPFRYAGEVIKAVKSKNASVKDISGYFDKAYNDHTGGVDPDKILAEFKKQQGVTVVDAKDKNGWKKAAQTVTHYLDLATKPIKALGQFVDEIPRDIEVRETERLFMKKHGQQIQNIQDRLDEVNGLIRQSQGATDPFDPALQGVDKLQSQKAKLEGMLENFNRDLKREQIFRSRDVMNYKRQGRGGVAKKIKQWVIFANTTTQSKDRLIRSFIERPGATLFKIGLTVSPFVAAQKIMYETMSDGDKKIYDDTPAYIKNFNYVFVKDGAVTAIPKLHELALLSNPIEAALMNEPMNDVAKLIAKETVPFQLGNIAQGMIPDEEGNTLLDRDPMTKNVMGVSAPSTVLTPFRDVMFNDKTGFNRKPISYRSDAANKWTLDVSKDTIGDNPNADAVEYLLRQLGGDYGKYAAYVADFAKEPGNEDKLDEMLRYLNPLQDRYYNPDSKFFRQPMQETRK